MEGGAPDTTEDWLLPEQSRPPLIGELERRVEEALATARASEAAVMTVGAAAIGAAEQAERAAGLAEKASAAALAVEERVASTAVALAPSAALEPQAAEGTTEEEKDSLSDFSARADRLVARLKQLQRVPLSAPASDAASRPRSVR
jgi:hypothetical protein